MPSSRLRVSFQDLIGRLTGFSTPFFGVSWKPPEPQREVVRRLLSFLEDRRVLFNPYFLEVEWQVEQSVIEIRRRLTETLDELSENSPAEASVRAMRAACRRFLDEPHLDAPHLGMDIGKPIRRMFVVPTHTHENKTHKPKRGPGNREKATHEDVGDLEDALTGQRSGHPDGSGFLIALGELRATFGTHIAFLAAQYGIDIEGDLASVLPAVDTE